MKKPVETLAFFLRMFYNYKAFENYIRRSGGIGRRVGLKN